MAKSLALPFPNVTDEKKHFKTSNVYVLHLASTQSPSLNVLGVVIEEVRIIFAGKLFCIRRIALLLWALKI